MARIDLEDRLRRVQPARPASSFSTGDPAHVRGDKADGAVRQPIRGAHIGHRLAESS